MAIAGTTKVGYLRTRVEEDHEERFRAAAAFLVILLCSLACWGMIILMAQNSSPLFAIDSTVM